MFFIEFVVTHSMNHGAVIPGNQSCSLFGVFVAKPVVSRHVRQNVVEKFACNNRYDFILKVVRQGNLKARYEKDQLV